MRPMDEIIMNIVAELRAGRTVDDRALLKFIHAAARASGADKRMLAKRRLLPYYRRIKQQDPARWESWGITPALEERLVATLRVKPRRSASGVATITVITKPWPCGSDCLYCPSDIRMPKSYLHDEPACERAEQNWFDPYLQVAARLTALAQMGHATDKIELIVLGGTWSDYPEAYQLWFMSELFRALNDGAVVPGGDAAEAAGGTAGTADASAASAVRGHDASTGVAKRRAFYREAGFPQDGAAFTRFAAEAQASIDAGTLGYNAALRQLYGRAACWRRAAERQRASFEELETLQRENERARHRVVGLVIETRPDAVTPEALIAIRRLGCTKVQMGVQSLDQRLLDANDRAITVARIQEAFELLRVFGFKIHAHAMANLFGATPDADKRDYRRLVTEAAFQPDEVKLYPCALIAGARLCDRYRAGTWRPYTEEELLDVLVADVLATPPFCRISRMIRDFSSNDILVGNKKPNLRQLVERRLEQTGDAGEVREIRFREVAMRAIDASSLRLDVVAYETTNTRERFLQWVTPDGSIAGFLRLSLPTQAYVEQLGERAPVGAGEAMIREVHVYGVATPLGEEASSAQHLSLGRRLVERACAMAREEGYGRVNVISAVGTRAYYRDLGFVDHGLYQQRSTS